MSGLRWRLVALCAVICTAAVLFSIQSAGTVTADEQGSSKPTKSAPQSSKTATAKAKKAAAEKAKAAAKKAKKKNEKSTKESDAQDQQNAASAGPSSSATSGGTSRSYGSGTTGSLAGGGAGGATSAGSSAGIGGGGGGANVGGAGVNPGGGKLGAAAAAKPTMPDPEVVRKVVDVQNRHSPEILKQEGIVGTATGLTKDGNVVFRVYTNGAGKPVIPESIEGTKTEVVVCGPIFPLDGFAGLPQFDPKVRQRRPIPIGVSAANLDSPDCTQSNCYSGTLGCRLKARDGSGYYALSNNHVFGGENQGSRGNVIVQPSPGDNSCRCDRTDAIGDLFRLKPLDVITIVGGLVNVPVNIMDAAIIKVSDQTVSNRTLPDGYGVPRTTPVTGPFLGMQVQKYGRTTGYTKGTIVSVNFITTPIAYPDAGGAAVFAQQLVVVGNGGAFSAPGDSGSLVVNGERFPVGLLFAGNSVLTVISPIQPVLDEFGMDIDGDDSDFVPPGKIGSAVPN
jgi:hypothetical protein